jgi:hypothetical protein
MATQVYPNSIIAFTDKTKFVDLVEAEHINQLQEEVTALETELGKQIKETSTSLKTRLAVCLAGDGAIVSSPSFPASPLAKQLFYQTSLDKLFIRNSSNSGWTSLSGLAGILCAGREDTPTGASSSPQDHILIANVPFETAVYAVFYAFSVEYSGVAATVDIAIGENLIYSESFSASATRRAVKLVNVTNSTVDVKMILTRDTIPPGSFSLLNGYVVIAKVESSYTDIGTQNASTVF